MKNGVMLLLVLVSLQGCGSREIPETSSRASSEDSTSPYQITPIPIDLNTLTDEQREIIQQGHALDPTPYLMLSRPTVFQIVETVNNADEIRRAGPVTEPAEVMIYALGESQDGRMVDHGWLENAETGAVVWEMTFTNSEHGGGDPRNRRAVETIRLDPGRYELRYVSNGSHAFGDWQGDPPERELFYGIVVFNLEAIKAINERFKKAGLLLE